MNENFDRCMQFVFLWEVGSAPNGGYHNDPRDPGGETKWGISKRAHPQVDIANLTREKASMIYYNEYWTPSHCQLHPWPWDLIVFDTAVNMGPSRANILFQENTDWREYLFGRINYYLNISAKTRDKFLKGWIRRVMDLNREARRIKPLTNTTRGVIFN